jgi:hypothetical protein
MTEQSNNTKQRLRLQDEALQKEIQEAQAKWQSTQVRTTSKAVAEVKHS